MASKGGWLRQIAAVLSLTPLAPTEIDPQQQQQLARQQRAQQQLLQRARGLGVQSSLGKPPLLSAPTAAVPPIVRPGQQVAANLMKASLLCVSIPLFCNIMVNHMLITHLLRGIKSNDIDILRLTLQRAKSYLFCEYLVNRFEEEDGMVLLLDFLNEHSRVVAEAAIPYFEALTHLARYDSARNTLLMLGIVERLERALEQGWLPLDIRERANSLYLDLHAARRIAIEEEFGSSYAGSLAAPKVFQL